MSSTRSHLTRGDGGGGGGTTDIFTILLIIWLVNFSPPPFLRRLSRKARKLSYFYRQARRPRGHSRLDFCDTCTFSSSSVALCAQRLDLEQPFDQGLERGSYCHEGGYNR